MYQFAYCTREALGFEEEACEDVDVCVLLLEDELEEEDEPKLARVFAPATPSAVSFLAFW